MQVIALINNVMSLTKHICRAKTSLWLWPMKRLWFHTPSFSVDHSGNFGWPTTACPISDPKVHFPGLGYRALPHGFALSDNRARLPPPPSPHASLQGRPCPSAATNEATSSSSPASPRRWRRQPPRERSEGLLPVKQRAWLLRRGGVCRLLFLPPLSSSPTPHHGVCGPDLRSEAVLAATLRNKVSSDRTVSAARLSAVLHQGGTAPWAAASPPCSRGEWPAASLGGFPSVLACSSGAARWGTSRSRENHQHWAAVRVPYCCGRAGRCLRPG